jgi:uncharacterized protein YbaR (Trm112 family)
VKELRKKRWYCYIFSGMYMTEEEMKWYPGIIQGIPYFFREKRRKLRNWWLINKP